MPKMFIGVNQAGFQHTESGGLPSWMETNGGEDFFTKKNDGRALFSGKKRGGEDPKNPQNPASVSGKF